jgi:3-oxoacyl-[acyl-carrier-protein] synthase-1
MAGARVVVVHAGMLTAVGLSPVETAASVRANMMRFEEVDWLDRGFEPFTLATVPDEALPSLAEPLETEAGVTTREARLLRLAAPALAQCLDPVGGWPGPVPLIVALPEGAGQPIDPTRFLRRLQRQAGLSLDRSLSSCLTKGRAGGVLAMRAGHELVSSNAVKFVAVGGVDSYLDPYLLGTLDMEKRVKTEQNIDAFVPGEGAAFLLLMTAGTASAAGLSPLATLTLGGEGFETGHLYSSAPCLGDGLATAFHSFFAAAHLTTPVLEVFSSMNGESYWAKEWGVALLRNKDAISEDFVFHHPADCYGDIGAASGPAMAALAALGLANRSCGSPALVYASSDRSERAAIGLTNPEEE